MGVFSELDIKNNMVEEETEDHFSDEETRIAMAEQHDDARQQAESDAAQAALARLNKQKSESEHKAEQESEAEKRRAHEEAEAKRKAEWEAKQKAKAEAEQMAWENAVAMEDEAVVAAAVKRSGDDAERITRRNMKQCVTEVIQTRCLEDAVFARQVMHPRKTMIRCFRYITRKARDFVKQEMEDNDENMNGGYGCDVPDDLCYQWAEEYFFDMDAEEDKEKEEKFVPKPYNGKPAPKSKKKTAAKKKEEPKNTAPSPSPDADKQMTLFGTEVA